MLQTKHGLKQRSRRGKPMFKVGDDVEILFMSRPVRARIVEDRGPIGIGGGRLYRVEAHTGSVTRTLELPSEELKKVALQAG